MVGKAPRNTFGVSFCWMGIVSASQSWEVWMGSPTSSLSSIQAQTLTDRRNKESLLIDVTPRCHDIVLEIGGGRYPILLEILTSSRSRRVTYVGCSTPATGIPVRTWYFSAAISIARAHLQRDANGVNNLHGPSIGSKHCRVFWREPRQAIGSLRQHETWCICSFYYGTIEKRLSLLWESRLCARAMLRLTAPPSCCCGNQ